MALVGLAAAVLVVAPGPAMGLAGSSFESTDGNLLASNGSDWATVGIVCDATSDNCALDKPSGSDDDALGKGSKDDHTTMTVVSGAVPNNKSDLTRFYVESQTIGSDVFLYLAWERANTLGTANFSFELNQLVQEPPPAAGGPWTLRRLPGDLLLLFDFESGGKADTLKLRASQWVTTGNPKQVCEASNTVPCWGKAVNLTATGFADGAVNTEEVVDPIAPPEGGRTLPSLTFGEAAVNLSAADLIDACLGFGSAMVRSRASAAFNSELKDFIAPLDTAILPPADIAGARASGSATGARVNDGSPVVTVETSRRGDAHGPGTTSASDNLAAVNVPEDGSSVRAGLVPVSSASTISAAPAGASQRSVAAAADVEVLDGVVTADAVRAVADAEAGPFGATYGSLGSAFENLRIDTDGPLGPSPPVLYESVAPNTTVELSSLAFGEGSFVKLYDEFGSVTPLPEGAAVGDDITWAADVMVRMIWAHVSDMDPINPGPQTVDVFVSEAAAHAEFASTICSLQEVSGNALVLREATDPSVAPVTVGYVEIPRLGGHAHQHLVDVAVNGSTISAAESDSTGTVEIGESSTASSYAEAAGVCLVPDDLGNCLVSADLVRSQANSAADEMGASSNATGTQFVGLSVAGVGAVENPAPNTRVDLVLEDQDGNEIANLGYVVLNEQKFVDQDGYTALTVTAIRVVLLPDEEGGQLAEVVVAQAHSDARF